MEDKSRYIFEHEEDKKGLCEILCYALQGTYAGDVLSGMEYVKDDNGLEIVSVRYHGGGEKKINVTGDSGATMLKDILVGLGY